MGQPRESYRTRFQGISLTATLQEYEEFHRGTLESKLIQRFRTIRFKVDGEIVEGSFADYAFFEIERIGEKRIRYTVRLKENERIIASIDVEEVTYKFLAENPTRTIIHINWQWEAMTFARNLLAQLHSNETFNAPPMLEAVDEPTKQAILKGVAGENPTKQPPAPLWVDADWYTLLVADDRQRYDWLQPHKEDWEHGKITDAQLATQLGKTSDTIRGWRRKLRKKGAPDMDWKKQKPGV